MDDLIAFLRAREVERAERAPDVHHLSCESVPDTMCGDYGDCDCGEPARVLAEVEAQRGIIEMYEGAVVASRALTALQGDLLGEAMASAAEIAALSAVRLLALPYADHADYRESWRQ